MQGMTRRIDQLGRIVIPAEFRRLLGIEAGDQLAMGMESGKLVIAKADPDCAICGGRDQLVEIHEKYICRTCVNALPREAARI
jgi:transcriptional pleiotropic regulator of transition state genes